MDVHQRLSIKELADFKSKNPEFYQFLSDFITNICLDFCVELTRHELGFNQEICIRCIEKQIDIFCEVLYKK